MCGIFGAVFLPHEVASAVNVSAALRAMNHRGPDAQGIHRSPGIVLGHARLSIIDLTPAGAQPMLSSDEQVVVVFNGEIYNHHEVRRELVSRGHSFRSRSDTEVIVEGYKAWGDKVVDRLDGMFAFAAINLREQTMLLARDRTGKKPLFYTQHRGGIWFASEMKCLFAAGVPAQPDVSVLPELLVHGYVPAPRTMIRNVVQLAPAHRMSVRPGSVGTPSRYWKAPFDASPLDHGLEEASSRVRFLVTEAVRKRLEADVPLGAFLSGGVDSTIIVGSMARLTGQRVKTFSIGFSGDARYDETHYARVASRAFNTEHTEFRIEPGTVHLIDRLVELHDGPFGDASAIPTSIVSMLTRKHVTVALTGDGGDELFCGYTRFLAGDAAERIPAVLRRLGGHIASRIPGGVADRDFLARVRRFLRVAARPLPDRMLHWVSVFGADVGKLLRSDVAATLDLEQPFAWNRAIFAAQNPATPLARILGYNFESYLPYDLLVKADRASMAHSLEVRSPFLDTELIEYAARLSDNLKRRGTNTKKVLKHAFRDMIPMEIQTRSKMGFGVPLGAWFRTDLREFLHDNLGPRARLYQWIDPQRVQTMLDEHSHQRADHGLRLWLLLTLERWLHLLPGMADTSVMPEPTSAP